jgi:hypothetical protein
LTASRAAYRAALRDRPHDHPPDQRALGIALLEELIGSLSAAARRGLAVLVYEDLAGSVEVGLGDQRSPNSNLAQARVGSSVALLLPLAVSTHRFYQSPQQIGRSAPDPWRQLTFGNSAAIELPCQQSTIAGGGGRIDALLSLVSPLKGRLDWELKGHDNTNP